MTDPVNQTQSTMWIALLPIIAQYGLPLAERLWTLSQSGRDPTPEDWAGLKALAAKNSAAYLAEAVAIEAGR